MRPKTATHPARSDAYDDNIYGGSLETHASSPFSSFWNGYHEEVSFTAAVSFMVAKWRRRWGLGNGPGAIITNTLTSPAATAKPALSTKVLLHSSLPSHHWRTFLLLPCWLTSLIPLSLPSSSTECALLSCTTYSNGDGGERRRKRSRPPPPPLPVSTCDRALLG